MPRLIQAGMGIHVSSAKLANTAARLGALGLVSGVALRHIVIQEIRSGDAEDDADPFQLRLREADTGCLGA